MSFLKISLFLFIIPFVYSQNKQDSKGLHYFKKAYKFNQQNKIDSAFYYYNKAEKQYVLERNSYNQARVLLNISNLQSKQNDLIGCEASLIKALTIFKDLKKQNKIYNCYNSLGILLKNNAQYDKSEEYYKKAFSIATALNSTEKQLRVLSNIAINYKEQKKYQNAITTFNKVLINDSIINYPIKKARALNYIAYCNFKLGNEDQLPQLFYDAKKLYKKSNHTQGIITNDIYLGEYYISKKKITKAKKVLDEGLFLAKKTKHNGKLLLLFKLLSKADTINAKSYFSSYTKLNDSILKVQLVHKNQFARIVYETAEKEKKIKQQQQAIKEKSKQQKMLLIILFLSVFSVLTLLYFNKKLNVKNKQINNLQIEIRHRLKNNLAMISSFVNKTKQQVTTPKEKALFDILIGRINSMKFIHQLLYKKSKTDQIELQIILTQIVNHCAKAFKEDKNITVTSNIVPIKINSKKAELIGLIVNELLTNAYKYAFVNKDVGKIKVAIFKKDKNILLLVKDDGIGFPKDMNSVKSTSYGLKLVKGLTQQLNGRITFINKKNGTETTLIIPL